MRTNTRILMLGSALIALLLSGCYSAKQAYQSGDYETAVGLAVRKLKKNPAKEKQIVVLEKAYNAALQRELDAIEYLKLEGNPECWVKIYERYQTIDRVQNHVKPLIPIYLESEFRDADIRIIDVNAEIVNAKQKAAEYLYANASHLLQRGDKQSARKAYYEFMKVKEFYANFRDVNNKIDQAYQAGQSYVLINMKNTSGQLIPSDFEAELKRINLSQVNSTWVKYYTKPNADIPFDYDLVVHLRDISIAPEQVIQRSFEETGKIKDGWEYVLDDNGNVAKDTAGNDIKVDVYRVVVALVTETQQRKAGNLQGSFDYFDRSSRQLVKSVPFNEVLAFENRFLTAQGDLRALTPETRKRLGGGPLPFPTNHQMIMDASNILKGRLSNSVRDHLELVMR